MRPLWRLSVHVTLHDAYVEFACAGLFSRSEAFRVNDEAFRRAAAENRRNVLVDARRVVGRVPTILDRYEIGVNVARNRGADARVFTDEAEAVRWLAAA